MKKNIRKLQLTTETLRNLEDRAAGQAWGGATGPSCQESCTCPNSSPGHTCEPGGPIITGPFYGSGCPSYSGGPCTVSCSGC